ncbi:unnamed protein product, partial [Rotaria sordida]
MLIHPKKSDIIILDDCTSSTLSSANTIRSSITSDIGINLENNKPQKNVEPEKVAQNHLRGVIQEKNRANAQKGLHVKQKNKLHAITGSYPDADHVLQKAFRQDTSCPPVDDAYPDLLSTIEEIATIGGTRDDRRSTETIRLYLTLDNL